ncbi:MAG: hypothetical protein JAY85_05265 [Candidatus Thiodiazotropha weberae]|nr:hypothetical protein [Candidatus Thiodiazotropha endoloripes]MCG7897853.1 hypothetical protein [Candidatus Thiodiazotropha weberae]MCG7901474.1 hypothetical protein [Candidatus Thiodiazotropha weberae]MCG7913751.1 hypothetical protein [Candidatus Thiodiazotropha weberae]
MKPSVMSAALAAALAGTTAGSASAGQYLSGDFHNHTTCSDGSTNVEVLTEKSLSYLDWFIHVGHSGSGTRDCRVSDFLYQADRSGPTHPGLWANTIGDGPGTDSAAIKGDYNSSTRGYDTVERMWRWQSLQEYNLPSIVTARELPGNEDKEAFLGLEWVVPGHEHSSNSISAGNYADVPNSDAIAQFEYCFARNSDDTSQGGGQGWTCELSDEANEKIKALFAGRPEEGVADYNSTLVDGVNIDDRGEHVKSTAGVLWMAENYPGESFSVGAHVERQGAFIEDDDEGFNVEHFRDWNTVAPEVAFGFESEPGHQAQANRGSYHAGRPTAGLFTFNGVGCYGGAEAAKPGENFDGEPITQADYDELYNSYYPAEELAMYSGDINKVTLCRPGVRTMWDAMLSEGRRFWYFASSDWHSRGSFGPLDFEADNDFWPGEFQEIFAYVEDYGDDPAVDIINSLRSGNSFSVQGQLISGKGFKFEACTSKHNCATMGETLNVRAGQKVTVKLVATDPKGANNSPYKFDNPSLLQVGIHEPVNKPSLRHVDFITGVVGKQFTPADEEYFNPLAPETTVIAKNFTYEADKSKIKATYKFRAEEDSYIRARGTNIPAGTPNVRDMDGNPLPDFLNDNIACDDPDCPPHVEGRLTKDLEAWANLNFTTNPIFIEVEGGAKDDDDDDEDDDDENKLASR